MRMNNLCKGLFGFSVLLMTACASQPQFEERGGTSFTIDELKERAEMASYAGQYQDAMLQYQQILSKEPDNIDALIGIGESLLGADQPERAENYLERALKLEPLNIKAREVRALSWLMQGNYTAAKTSLSNIVDDGAQLWRVWNGLGVIDDLLGDYMAALGHYQRAIDLAPERAMLHNNLGYSQIMAHDYTGAAVSLEKALLLEPGNPRVLNNLALCNAWQGRYDEAIDILSPVMGAAETNNNIGYIAYLRQDYLRAKELFTKAMRLRPAYYIKAANNLEMVNRKLALE
jgi:Flp pilus assembly protein TadD